MSWITAGAECHTRTPSTILPGLMLTIAYTRLKTLCAPSQKGSDTDVAVPVPPFEDTLMTRLSSGEACWCYISRSSYM